MNLELPDVSQGVMSENEEEDGEIIAEDNGPLIQRFESVDYLSSYLVNSSKTSRAPLSVFGKLNQHFKSAFENLTFLNFLFLVTLGILNAVVSFTLDLLISKVLIVRERVSILTDYYSLNYVLFITYSLVFSFFAALLPQLISIFSIGSGIPELKSILSGIRMNRYMSFRTLVAKFLGLIASFGGGFFIGKEGPFVHISACIASLLLKVKLFKPVMLNEYQKNQIVSVAAAAGISATFGCPFGGVLFSIEVCSTYFPIECLWKGVFCSLVGSSIFYLFRNLSSNVEISLFETNFDHQIELDEYIPMVVLSVVCGLLGSLFIEIVKLFYRIRQSQIIFSKYKLHLVVICSFIISALSFPLAPFLTKSNHTVVNILFSEYQLDEEVVDNKRSLFLSLLFSIIVKFILTGLSVTLPLSMGLFTAVFIIGAGIGRVFGELTKFIYKNDSHIIPGGYAVVGATAFSSSVTRTLSTAVILFELTGQIKYLIPVLVSVCISNFIGNLFNLSIYDTFLKLKKLPIFTVLTKKKELKVDAKDFMKKNIDYIVQSEYNITKLKTLIRTTNHYEFPLVDNSMFLIGTVSRDNIIMIIENKNIKKGINDNIEFYAKANQSRKYNFVEYDPSYISISQLTPLRNIFFIFSHLGLAKVFVLDK